MAEKIEFRLDRAGVSEAACETQTINATPKTLGFFGELTLVDRGFSR
ncbi:MAG TPA: hypothetical protein VIY69_04950 [Candidatus Acidoferrales bacterium]